MDLITEARDKIDINILKQIKTGIMV